MCWLWEPAPNETVIAGNAGDFELYYDGNLLIGVPNAGTLCVP